MPPTIDLIFISTHIIDLDKFLDEEKFFVSYFNIDNIDFADFYIDSQENLHYLLEFIFNRKLNLVVLASENNRSVYDLTAYKKDCITFEDLEERYQEWILRSKRKNTMDEYGNFIGIISLIRNKSDKKYLIMISDKTKLTL